MAKGAQQESGEGRVTAKSRTVCSAAMAKRVQQESAEERVTAKSKPLMNLIARTPVVRIVFNFIEPGEEIWET